VFVDVDACGCVSGVCVGLRNVSVQLPSAVKPGDSATLVCDYDLEGDQLYTVKWYKGRQEFFRFVLKDYPNTQVFPLDGVFVNVSNAEKIPTVFRSVFTGKNGL